MIVLSKWCLNFLVIISLICMSKILLISLMYPNRENNRLLDYYKIISISRPILARANKDLDFVSGQYGCLFSRCRKYIINSLCIRCAFSSTEFTKWLKVNDWKRTESYTVGLQQYSSTLTAASRILNNRWIHHVFVVATIRIIN
jgi:hypothetical protein